MSDLSTAMVTLEWEMTGFNKFLRTIMINYSDREYNFVNNCIFFFFFIISGDTRISLLKICMEGTKLDEEFDFPEISELLEGYTGSDIANVCR